MLYIAIDIGGTFIKHALMDRGGNIWEKGKIPSPADLESFLRALKGIIAQYPQARGVCVSCPGLVDVETGIVYHGGWLHFLHQVNLKQEIHALCDLPVEIENDAKSAGLAEALMGNASGVQDSIVIVLGTGIGGALIKDKRVIHGKNLMAGEFSWIIPDMNKRYEADPTKHTLLHRETSAKSLVEKVSARKNIPASTLTGELVYQLAEEGDVICQEVIAEFYRTLAVQLANLQHIFDPELICVGGGISQRPGLLEDIRQAVDQVYVEYALKMAKPTLTLCKFQSDSNLIGALCHFLQRTGEMEGL